MQLFSFQDYILPALKLAHAYQQPLTMIKPHYFPDGECRIQLPEKIDQHMVIIRSLDNPNKKLIELLLTCKTARANGVERITLICPYLCYMRQDIAFHPGESVSQQIIGQFLADTIDDIITVDPHLHRIERLQQAIPCNNALSISASHAITEHIKKQRYTLLVGPDSESEQWVEGLAAPLGIKSLVANKQRSGDREVNVEIAKGNYSNEKVLIIDDIISTGQTLAKCALALQINGARSIDCICTHALHEQKATALLLQSGINHIYSCDSIIHPSNQISLTSSLKSALDEICAH